MSDLKPCPFCGGNNVDLVFEGNEHTKSRKVTVKCADCRFTRTDATVRHDHKWLAETITKAWNTRPLEDALEAENQRLRNAMVKAWSVLRGSGEEVIDYAWHALDDALRALDSTGDEDKSYD